MSILDTDVLAALMRTVPEAPVVAWLDRPPAESVWITGITLFEARLGLLPSGLLKEDLENRVLDFDSVAAAEAALLAAARQKSGGQWTCVTQIAGIALARRATVATRNVRHFADLRFQ